MFDNRSFNHHAFNFWSFAGLLFDIALRIPLKFAKQLITRLTT